MGVVLNPKRREDLIKRKREMLLNDPLIKKFDDLIAQVIIASPSKYLVSGVTSGKLRDDGVFALSDDAVMERVFDQDTQKLISKITKNRDVYIQMRYDLKM